MNRPIVAWDIETCPTPLDELTDAQRRRFDKELRRQLRDRPEMGEEAASSLVRSVHPLLGWICCVSVVTGRLGDEPNAARSYATATRDGEADLLARFWNDVAQLPRGVVWATFNGKRFDAPFLLARTLHHHLTPTRTDLLNTYPFRHQPHADLARIWPQSTSLDDLCDMLGVPTPKGSLDGSRVAEAVAAGRLADVVRYCEGDVAATHRCLQAMPVVLHL